MYFISFKINIEILKSFKIFSPKKYYTDKKHLKFFCSTRKLYTLVNFPSLVANVVDRRNETLTHITTHKLTHTLIPKKNYKKIKYKNYEFLINNFCKLFFYIKKKFHKIYFLFTKTFHFLSINCQFFLYNNFLHLPLKFFKDFFEKLANTKYFLKN